MNLTLNGQRVQTQAANVAELLVFQKIDPLQAAVERNGAIVPRSRHGQEELMEGDMIEIVKFIGGG